MSMRMRRVVQISHMEGMINLFEILVGERPPGWPRRKWEDIIRMDLKDTVAEVWTCMRLRIETSGGIL